MKKVLLLTPPRPGRKPVEREECCWGEKGYVAFPFHLASIAAQLQYDAKLEVYDANAMNKSFDDIERKLIDSKPDIVVVGITESFAPFEARIAGICEKRGIECVALAVPFGYYEEFAKSYPFTFVIHSQPEKVLWDYVRGKPREQLRGIAYKAKKKVLKKPAAEPCFKDLPRIPWDLFDLNRYDGITYQISRGCFYGCPFCVWAPLPWEMVPALTVAEEMEELEKMGVTKVRLLCAQITSNKKWLDELCDEIGKRGIKIVWSTNTRANELTREALARMREAGCVKLEMGVESLNAEVLEKYAKKVTLQQIEGAITMCRQEGIPLKISLMFGMGETDEDVEEYIDFVMRVKPFDVTSDVVLGYKGTECEKKFKKEAKLSVSTDIESTMSSVKVPDDYEQAMERRKRFKKGIAWLKVWSLVWMLTSVNALSVLVRHMPYLVSNRVGRLFRGLK